MKIECCLPQLWRFNALMVKDFFAGMLTQKLPHKNSEESDQILKTQSYLNL